LVRAGPPGLNITDIQTRLDVPASTLAFHLRGLVGAGPRRAGKKRAHRDRAQYDRMDGVIEFLREQCCEGFESDLPAATRRAG